MPRRKSPALGNALSAITAKPSLGLFAKTNRGLLLDIVVFIANIFLMRMLTAYVIGLFKAANEDDQTAKLILITGTFGMWGLPVAGALLKRWHFHQRLLAENKTIAFDDLKLGCLFNPIFFFCLNLVVMAAILAGAGQFLFGDKGMDNGAIFVPMTFAGLGLTIFQTYLIYRYFSAPKKPPTSGFLLSPESDFLGDVCLFLNMLLFQCAWNLLTYSPLGRVSTVPDFLGRLFFLCFIALLIYFPPRMFYLAEDINRKRTWVTMFLANSPVIFKVLIGVTPSQGW